MYHSSRMRICYIAAVAVEMVCSNGCLQCSAYNGCLSCRRPFFLTLQRSGARQIALCQRSCPQGYYKARYSRKRFCASKSMLLPFICIPLKDIGGRYCTVYDILCTDALLFVRLRRATMLVSVLDTFPGNRKKSKIKNINWI